MFNKSKKLKRKDLAGQLPDPFSLREDWFELPGVGQFLLHEWNSDQRDAWEWRLINREVVIINETQQKILEVDQAEMSDPRGLKPWVIAQTLLDPSTSKRMYDDSAEDLAEIGSWSPRITDPLYRACLVINGLREVDYTDAKKNSAVTTTSETASGSPAGGAKPLPNSVAE